MLLSVFESTPDLTTGHGFVTRTYVSTHTCRHQNDSLRNWLFKSVYTMRQKNRNRLRGFCRNMLTLNNHGYVLQSTPSLFHKQVSSLWAGQFSQFFIRRSQGFFGGLLRKRVQAFLLFVKRPVRSRNFQVTGSGDTRKILLSPSSPHVYVDMEYVCKLQNLAMFIWRHTENHISNPEIANWSVCKPIRMIPKSVGTSQKWNANPNHDSLVLGLWALVWIEKASWFYGGNGFQVIPQTTKGLNLRKVMWPTHQV